MTGLSARRARMLRLRTIEHRVAAIRLMQTDAQLRQLTQVVGRLGALKLGLCASSGTTTGRSLKSNIEMSVRLDAAATSMLSPIAEAKAQRAACEALRIQKQQREDSASKLYHSAVAREDQVRAMRADANRSFRKRLMMLGDGK